MAKILAIDTSGEACSVALLGDGIEQVETVLSAREHTKRVLPMVDAILLAAGVTLADIDAIAFGRGPGSFTGLRITAGIVQGLAFAARLPVIPVSSLAALAQGWYRDDLQQKQLDNQSQDQQQNQQEQTIAAAFDARMSEVYFACFRVSQDSCELQGEEIVSAPQDVVISGSESIIAVGSGWVYDDLLAQTKTVSVDKERMVSALDIATLAQREFAKGNTLPAAQAVPVYLRNEVSWKKVAEQ